MAGAQSRAYATWEGDLFNGNGKVKVERSDSETAYHLGIPYSTDSGKLWRVDRRRSCALRSVIYLGRCKNTPK